MIYGDARVFDFARIYENSWVLGDAQICANARIYGNARINGDTMVGGMAMVCGNTKIFGNANVYGYARVSGDARLYGNAKICDTADYICFQGLGSENRNTTFFKCQDGHVHVDCGCFAGTIDEFVQQVKKTHEDNKFAREYIACVDVVKIHFSENGEPDGR